MSYAEVEDLRSRAGRLGDAWDDTTTPNTGDLERYLRDASDEVDVGLAGLGFAVPVTNAVGAASLRVITAELALYTAVTRTWVGGAGPEAARDLLAEVGESIKAWRTALADGSLSVIKLLTTQDTANVSGASNFWEDEQYSAFLDDMETGRIVIDNGPGVGLWRTPTGPEIHKGTRF